MTDSETGTRAEPPGIQVIARAAGILRALKADNRGLSLGRIAARVGLPRSTVQRIVNALAAERLVAANTVSGGYQLGPEILTLAQAGRRDVAGALHPVIEALSRDTGETVDLAVFRDDGMVFIDQVVGSQRLRTVSAIGETFPMTVTANGKAALTWLEDGDLARIAAAERRRPNAVKAEIRAVLDCGYALDIGEHSAEVSAAGIAFRVRGAIYAISVPVPSQRFHDERETLIRKLGDLKAEIVRLLPDAEFRTA